ncbi:hypothetical protein BATDEDRAFT_90356 [Batrachochytrium dendrobatidis JAM81]|uniref:Uncharacterized protein n=2 Tax=Batrachochytrium dendrobatidis TaxID=109871 RepID=F4P8E9_BATDJ|nr:uncharacterized protein BATDEDRAFT_90356 [Batrachochytrium dendrobatidis JAM81]EGF78607.1 hypothetical protein BATDEDRAFT_90356 [Batrachochytrium dendrobatidis JAM81]OAJ43401.1 hypothetical protein BDEG_26764 [Batrachochytrium dendrobatidis JEL423]|eukprot:XP_006680909.1 hypothetical protein BATDEDRAFT_90356 [Batrachochytrium dendrobatidis JAM81]
MRTNSTLITQDSTTVVSNTVRIGLTRSNTSIVLTSKLSNVTESSISVSYRPTLSSQTVKSSESYHPPTSTYIEHTTAVSTNRPLTNVASPSTILHGNPLLLAIYASVLTCGIAVVVMVYLVIRRWYMKRLHPSVDCAGLRNPNGSTPCFSMAWGNAWPFKNLKSNSLESRSRKKTTLPNVSSQVQDCQSIHHLTSELAYSQSNESLQTPESDTMHRDIILPLQEYNGVQSTYTTLAPMHDTSLSLYDNSYTMHSVSITPSRDMSSIVTNNSFLDQKRIKPSQGGMSRENETAVHIDTKRDFTLAKSDAGCNQPPSIIVNQQLTPQLNRIKTPLQKGICATNDNNHILARSSHFAESCDNLEPDICHPSISYADISSASANMMSDTSLSNYLSSHG